MFHREDCVAAEYEEMSGFMRHDKVLTTPSNMSLTISVPALPITHPTTLSTTLYHKISTTLLTSPPTTSRTTSPSLSLSFSLPLHPSTCASPSTRRSKVTFTSSVCTSPASRLDSDGYQVTIIEWIPAFLMNVTLLILQMSSI